MNVGQYRSLCAAQRYALARVAKSYSTASAVALGVVTAAAPIHLLAKEARVRYLLRRGLPTDDPRDAGIVTLTGDLRGLDAAEGRKRLRMAVEEAWGTEYLGARQASVTKLYFPTVRDRLEATWVGLDHYTTQFLTGHGDFGSKLWELGLRATGDCWCGALDTSEHTLLECPVFDKEREPLRLGVTSAGMEWPPPLRDLVCRDLFPLFKSTAGLILRAKEEYGKRHHRDLGQGARTQTTTSSDSDQEIATAAGGDDSH